MGCERLYSALFHIRWYEIAPFEKFWKFFFHIRWYEKEPNRVSRILEILFSYHPPLPGLFLSVWPEFLERGKVFQQFSRSGPLKNCVRIFSTRLSHCHGPLYYMYTYRCLLTHILGLPGWNVFKTWAHRSIYHTHTTITLPRWHILKTSCLRASSGGTYM